MSIKTKALANLREAFPGIWVREDGAIRLDGNERGNGSISWEPGDVEGDTNKAEGEMLRSGLVHTWRTSLKLSQVQALADYITEVDARAHVARFEAEKETAREQLEREPEEDSLAPEGMPECAWETVTLTEAAPADEQDDASEFAFDDGAQEMLEESYAPGHSDADLPTLTGDPAIEPETGLHEERPALNEAMQDEREEKPQTIGYMISEGQSVELRSDGTIVPLTQPEWNEPEQNDYDTTGVLTADDMQAVAMPNYAEYPAAVTNPEADALAKAHDYYSPEKIADRNRFNPFAMFRREPEDA